MDSWIDGGGNAMTAFDKAWILMKSDDIDSDDNDDEFIDNEKFDQLCR